MKDIGLVFRSEVFSGWVTSGADRVGERGLCAVRALFGEIAQCNVLQVMT